MSDAWLERNLPDRYGPNADMESQDGPGLDAAALLSTGDELAAAALVLLGGQRSHKRWRALRDAVQAWQAARPLNRAEVTDVG